MKALQLQGLGKLELIEMPLPEITDDELLIKTGAALICTSDLNDIRENPFGIALPVILGHEGAGEVVDVGSRVEGVHVGDHVATHPVHPCGICRNCSRGMQHLCLAMGHFGLNMQGTFAEYFVVRADRARVVPRDVPFPVVALAEPVSVCLESLAQARLFEGDNLLIIGDGPFGILMAMLAGDLHLGSTVIAGHHDFRLAVVKNALPINTSQLSDPLEGLRTSVEDGEYDAVILAVGSAQAAQWGLELLRAKGRMVVFSALPGQTPLNLFDVHVRELEIVGACNDQERLDEAVQFLIEHTSELTQLVTHRFGIEQHAAALRVAATGHASALKVAFTF